VLLPLRFSLLYGLLDIGAFDLSLAKGIGEQILNDRAIPPMPPLWAMPRPIVPAPTRQCSDSATTPLSRRLPTTT